MRRVLFAVLLALTTSLSGQATYRFEEGATRDILDSSWQGHHGRAHEISLVPHGRGVAAHFNGGSARIVVPRAVFSDFGNTAYVAAWIRPDAYPSGPRGCASTIFRKRAHENDWLLTLDQDGSVACALYGREGVADVQGGHAPKGVWTKVACSYDGSTLRLRVRDAVVDSEEHKLTLDWETGYRVTEIGNNTADAGVNCPDYAFHGDIDEITIAQRRPTAAQLPAETACADSNTILCVGMFNAGVTAHGRELDVTERRPRVGGFGSHKTGTTTTLRLTDTCTTSGTFRIQIVSIEPTTVTIGNLATGAKYRFPTDPAKPIDETLSCMEDF